MCLYMSWYGVMKMRPGSFTHDLFDCFLVVFKRDKFSFVLAYFISQHANRNCVFVLVTLSTVEDLMHAASDGTNWDMAYALGVDNSPLLPHHFVDDFG